MKISTCNCSALICMISQGLFQGLKFIIYFFNSFNQQISGKYLTKWQDFVLGIMVTTVTNTLINTDSAPQGTY